ncbi:fimbrial protein [Serratia fonticola]|uniref:fimbrial protein n=1 Tax=Serratia fonticola TaxID=47917 RepID=UPI0021786A74|nr:fimbrial protein [Serratia fonticola]CAI1981562.1 putative minor fimbrial subunit StfF [Serratia fonticola]
MSNKWQQILISALVGFTVSDACSVDMEFKGTLIEPPPCIVNGGQDINVSFDKVGINKIDGDSYRKEINFILDCIDSPPWTMSMTLSSSSVASFSPGTIQSTINGLGIKIYSDGKPIAFSQPILIDPARRPKLEAVPLSEYGVTLSEGKFTASATLTVQYQ